MAFSYVTVARSDVGQTVISTAVFQDNGQVSLCLSPPTGFIDGGIQFTFGDYIGVTDTPQQALNGRQALLGLDADGRVVQPQMVGSSFGTSISHMQADGRGNIVLLGRTSFGTARFGSLRTGAGTFLARRTGKGDFGLLRSMPVLDHVLAVDGPGNMFVVTQARDTAIELDGHTLPIFRTHFIKFTPEGRAAWVASPANPDPVPDPFFYIPSLFVTHAVVDAAGHPVFAWTGGPTQFGDVNLTNLPPTVAKFDREDGRLLWAKSLHPGPTTPVGVTLNALLATSDGGFLVGGQVTLRESLPGVPNPAPPAIGSTLITRGRGHPVAYVGRLDAQGEFLWASVIYMQGLADPFANGIGVAALAIGASGTVYLASGYGCGTWLGNIQLGSNCGSRTDADGAVAALTPDGQWLWAKTFGGSKDEIVTHLGVDAAENLYITGRTKSGDAKFDSFTVAASGEQSAFLAKLSSGRSAVVNPERTLEGDLRFQVLGTAGLTNRVECSTNLVTWTLFTEFVAQRASTTVLVPASPTGPPRYYRASAK